VVTPVFDPPEDEVTPPTMDVTVSSYRCNDCVEWDGFQERCFKRIGDMIQPTAQYPHNCPHFHPKEEKSAS
jgi:hypothetical protein